MAKPDIMQLTEQETYDLAIECLNMLSLERRMSVVTKVFGDDADAAELIDRLEDDESLDC